MIASIFRWAIVAPLLAIVLFAKLVDHPWLLWAAPLALVLLAIIAVAACIGVLTARDVRRIRAEDARAADAGAVNAFSPTPKR